MDCAHSGLELKIPLASPFDILHPITRLLVLPLRLHKTIITKWVGPAKLKVEAFHVSITPAVHADCDFLLARLVADSANIYIRLGRLDIPFSRNHSKRTLPFSVVAFLQLCWAHNPCVWILSRTRPRSLFHQTKATCRCSSRGGRGGRVSRDAPTGGRGSHYYLSSKLCKLLVDVTFEYLYVIGPVGPGPIQLSEA